LKTVLCYGDSNTYGYDAIRDGRFLLNVRWPGILQERLGSDWHVIEEGLNHRTTTVDDPENEGRNGSVYLLPCLHSHRPLDLVIIMLGSNDMKAQYNRTPEQITQGMADLVKIVRASNCGRGINRAEILLMSPPLAGDQYDYADAMEGITTKAPLLPYLYRQLAETAQCLFLDASFLKCPYPDGIHLGPNEHLQLGNKVADFLLNRETRLISI